MESNLLGLTPKTSRWIDNFQSSLSLPVALRVAEKISDPLGNSLRILSIRDYQNVAHLKMLSLIMGPFGIEHDNRFTIWHGFKAVIRGYDVISVICRFNSNGDGGFYLLKLWDKYEKKYTYLGDPEQKREIGPNFVIQLICDHLAEQFHFGFVEQKENSLVKGKNLKNVEISSIEKMLNKK